MVFRGWRSPGFVSHWRCSLIFSCRNKARIVFFCPEVELVKQQYKKIKKWFSPKYKTDILYGEITADKVGVEQMIKRHHVSCFQTGFSGFFLLNQCGGLDVAPLPLGWVQKRNTHLSHWWSCTQGHCVTTFAQPQFLTDIPVDVHKRALMRTQCGRRSNLLAFIEFCL